MVVSSSPRTFVLVLRKHVCSLLLASFFHTHVVYHRCSAKGLKFKSFIMRLMRQALIGTAAPFLAISALAASRGE